MRISIVGPTKSGKTVYLASLLRAGFAKGRKAKRIKVRADPTNALAVALEENASSILTGGVLPGTSAVNQIELFADLPGSFLFNLGHETLRLTMVDVPGGDCMPTTQELVHPAVQHSIAEADALMIIVPADVAMRPSDFCQRLTHLFAASMDRKKHRHGAYPFLRVAIVVTMAEILVSAQGNSALAALEELDAQQEVEKLCGPALVPIIRRLTSPGADWYALVSAFGFDRDTGAAASVRTDHGWKVDTGNAAFKDNWSPYRVFEPLEFLGRGVCWTGEM